MKLSNNPDFERVVVLIGIRKWVEAEIDKCYRKIRGNPKKKGKKR